MGNGNRAAELPAEIAPRIGASVADSLRLRRSTRSVSNPDDHRPPADPMEPLASSRPPFAVCASHSGSYPAIPGCCPDSR